MLLELELRRIVEIHNKSKQPVNICIVVYEMKATDLSKHYLRFVMYLERIQLIQIQVMSLAEICKTNGVQYENRYDCC